MKFLALVFIVFLISCNTKIRHQYGGYDYPKNINNLDTSFSYYPIKDTVSPKDSFYIASNSSLYKLFDEPNLSLKPFKQTIFRLTYLTARGTVIIITLKQGLLTKKEGLSDTVFSFDTSKLTKLEKLLYFIGYPLREFSNNIRERKYNDSMIQLYPQMLSPQYHMMLRQKVFVRLNKPFNYAVENIALSNREYTSLIDEINLSGFETLKYSYECKLDFADGYTMILEANTENKYYVASTSGCTNENEALSNVCEKILSIFHPDKEAKTQVEDY